VLGRQEKRTDLYRFIKVKVKLTLEQARDAQKGSSGIARGSSGVARLFL
jgi:hypothetical protein